MENDLSELEPITGAYWVEEGRLLAGKYPGTADERQARSRVRWLLSCGVDFYLDLTQAGEYGLLPYADWLAEEAVRIGKNIIHRRIPIGDYTTPPIGDMLLILDTLDGALQEGHVVYLHCFGGKGRTGTVVGCYLVRRGMDGLAALERIAALREGAPDITMPSPETEEQRQFVLGWKEEDHAHHIRGF